MKKILGLCLFLSLAGCSTVESIPNLNDQVDVDYSNEEDLLASQAIYEGISVEGIEVEGLNLQSVKPVLEEKLDEKLDQEVVLSYKDKTYTKSLRDLGYYIDYDQIARKALAIGREGSEEARLAEIKSLKSNPLNLESDLVLGQSGLGGFVSEISKDIDVEAIKPKYSYDWDTDSVVAKDGQDGFQVDGEALRETIEKGVESGQYKLEIPVKEIAVAKDAQAQAARVNGIIGTAESYFGTGFWARVENIRVSTHALDGLVLAPGETFSFNDYIGDTTYEKGYQQSIVIDENNREVPGMGGGVCQTSTALYHSALKSDLQILNRSPHTQFMPYSPGGLDAAVEYGSADLAFRNNFDFPILIRTYYEPGYIKFTIYGDTSVKDYDVSIFSEQIGASTYSAYKRNEATGEVTYLGDTYYPPAN